jgi:hypothetical protein
LHSLLIDTWYRIQTRHQVILVEREHQTLTFIGADDIVFDSAGDAYVTIDASKLDDDSWWTELHALDLESGELTYLARVSYGYNDGGQSYWETVTPVASRVEGGL